MVELSAFSIVASLIGLFFLIGAIGNWIAPPRIGADYVRWGYPAYFHYVTAVLELATGVLLLLATTRVFGAVLGVLVMAAALATLLRHKEYSHALPALLVFGACVTILALASFRLDG